MRFQKISINDWQQFGKVDIAFHKKLTVITGANGSGKTTILNTLARHFNWEVQSLALPQKDTVQKIWQWLTGLLPNGQTSVGEIEYSDGQKSSLVLPENSSSAQYQLQIENKQQVECFYIPSHRSVFRYQAIGSIPTQGTIDRIQAFNRVSDSNRTRYFGGDQSSSSFFMKETLIAWNLFGRGNEDMEANEIMLENYKGFESVLKLVLPKDLGFKKFSVRNFEVVLECLSGDFIIDAASGGISALIDMAWQIYMYSSDKKSPFTVLIDEVENHLHPSMQRRILGDLINAFPHVSFIVTTHSPLIVGSVKDSFVYVLRYENDGQKHKVITEQLDLVNKAKTATEILDEVLGVSFTMPIWAEEELNSIVSKYLKEDITPESLSAMRSELATIGLEKLVPTAVTKLVQEKDAETK